MHNRPISVTVIGCIFIAAGVVGIAYHANEFKLQHPFAYVIILVFLLRLLAILGGVYVLRARNWARWLLVGWIGFHAILSVFHSLSEVIMHGVLFAIVTYVLFRPRASAYFRSMGTAGRGTL